MGDGVAPRAGNVTWWEARDEGLICGAALVVSEVGTGNMTDRLSWGGRFRLRRQEPRQQGLNQPHCGVLRSSFDLYRPRRGSNRPRYMIY